MPPKPGLELGRKNSASRCFRAATDGPPGSEEPWVNEFITYQGWFSYLNGTGILVISTTPPTYVVKSIVDFAFSPNLAILPYGTVLNSMPVGFVDPPIDGDASGYDTLAEGFSLAKNTLAVGAMAGDLVYSIPYLASYSSCGPTDDGRIKPDLVAFGGEEGGELNGLGALSDSDYSASGAGTSFAAPAVAGAVTLLSQYQEKLRGATEPLRASTLKALMIHSARDEGNPGPDFQFGWGSADAAAAAEIIKTNTRRSRIKEILIPNNTESYFPVTALGGQPVKVTIAWNDPPGAAQPNQLDPPGTAPGLKVLVNDMNLTLSRTSPAATWFPWKWDSSTQAPSDNLITGVNDRDNVEQVIVPSPAAGTVLNVRIRQLAGSTLSGGSQWVSVILSGVRTDGGASEASITSSSYSSNAAGWQRMQATFQTLAGGYYRIQCRTPYMSPGGGGPDAPWSWASPVFYARSNVMTATSDYQNPGMYGLEWRVVSVAANPFNDPTPTTPQ